MVEESENVNQSLSVIAKSSFVVFIGIFLSKVLTYVYKIIIGNYGPEMFGLFSLALVIVGWFITIFSLGLPEGLVRYISYYRGKKDPERIKYIINMSLVTLTVSTVIGGVVLFLFSDFTATTFFHNAGLSIFLKLFSIVIPLTALSSIFLAVMRSYERMKPYTIIFNVVQNVAKVALIVLFLIIGLTANKSVIFSYIAGVASMVLAAFLYCMYALPQVFGKTSLIRKERSKIKKELFAYSIPLTIASIFFTIFYWVDTVMIGYFKNVTQVGIYGAGVTIALLITVIPELFVQIFFPIITKEYSKNNQKTIEELSKQVTKWILMITLPAFILMALFPSILINFFFDERYLDAVIPMRFILTGLFISALANVPHYLLLMKGKSRLILINVIIAAAINVVLNVILIPMPMLGALNNASGMTGAALATFISLTFLNILVTLEAWYFTRIVTLRRTMLQVIIAAAIPALILFAFARKIYSFEGLIGVSLLFFLIYGVLILLFRGLDKNDLYIIRKTFKKFPFIQSGKDTIDEVQ
ncbi:flippase [Candidatus Pacearchaeota archaeon]|nr:flippase [Candidatus Pacearchaeota archaeon]